MMTQIRSIWMYAELGHSDGEQVRPPQEHFARWDMMSRPLVPCFHFSYKLCRRAKSSTLAVHFAETETWPECDLKPWVHCMLKYQHLAPVCCCWGLQQLGSRGFSQARKRDNLGRGNKDLFIYSMWGSNQTSRLEEEWRWRQKDLSPDTFCVTSHFLPSERWVGQTRKCKGVSEGQLLKKTCSDGDILGQSHQEQAGVEEQVWDEPCCFIIFLHCYLNPAESSLRFDIKGYELYFWASWKRHFPGLYFKELH